MKKNNSTELLGISFDNIYSKSGPPESLDPKTVSSPGFPRLSIENQFFFVSLREKVC